MRLNEVELSRQPRVPPEAGMNKGEIVKQRTYLLDGYRGRRVREFGVTKREVSKQQAELLG